MAAFATDEGESGHYLGDVIWKSFIHLLLKVNNKFTQFKLSVH